MRRPLGEPPWIVSVVIHDGAELLDFAGPLEVFSSAAIRGPRRGGSPWFAIETLAPAGSGPIRASGGLSLLPDRRTDEAGAVGDLLILPGGETGRLLEDPAFMGWAERACAEAPIVMSVCTGAFVLARLGMLAGREVATHHSMRARLGRLHPELRVRGDRRVTGDPPILTTAGVSAGIDGALHLVALLLGLDVAERTARAMEYEWRTDARGLEDAPTLNPWLDPIDRGIQGARRHARSGLWAEAELALDAHLQSGDARVWKAMAALRVEAGDPAGARRALSRASTLAPGDVELAVLEARAAARLDEHDVALEAVERAVGGGVDPQALLDLPELSGLAEQPRLRALLGQPR